MKMEFSLPTWNVPPSAPEQRISEEVYLRWLGEERARLIHEGLLPKLQADVGRRPVDARFVWR